MNTDTVHSSWQQWQLHRSITPRNLLIAFVAFALLSISAHNTEMDKAFMQTSQALLSAVGIGESPVLDGAIRFGSQAFPLVISQRTPVNRLDEFDRDNLPLFAYIEVAEDRDYDALTDSWEVETTEFLVEPVGYLVKVSWKMWETIEMGFWGTFISIMISLPLGILSSRNYTPHRIVYSIARGWLSLHRAMPELIIALFLVLMYGFGPIAGVLALAIHTSGVLGKFFADEIENAPPGPQLALKASGASSLKVLRYAVFPHVFPAWIAYVQYIFERNIRTATVLGIVGAGGIGMELKGRWDLFDYGHVTTILLAIFITVLLLEYFSQKMRNKTL
ncbi:MAG: phosphonate ABC transporter, permease protein PhnE [Candidatus Thiodiazotropha lotti]|uniref:Phosphonate ABC transporter, permease protein PhnE n=1 Tax=Candidatus Thiodiazotropha endoloripes TaxID=1818881 RepID=A0A1E2UHK3_9GAMM|nr:phosphonate ABC transporter, permease protein PhnE [Candidatus Thiodiazotropha endoloripes]MCG7897251.1 phosphonate ABC transporter, permease protein PhnE [Candidatus Thiodiazotropha weberae]MCG7993074.1 phosphonate ABC transporter, permease protein PhnE [Candidatus Thiodiazotropha lotti]MCG7902533.1 phosphonate ABC transporter, permease protein PhnE [Candidatus Thiodiazotropha weberae]MCG7913568.1 phosphonate ABC transporter, permease protein PhnE [Candidatus Thiodiazotropha weberae]MCG800